MPTCLLVRHGHSSANGEGMLAGRLPGIHLTEAGRDQAARLAQALTGVPVARVVSSPLERCLETATPLAAAAGVELTVEVDLQECAYGAWTGRKLADLAKEPLWATVQDNPRDARFPEDPAYAAESLTEMAHRVTTAVRRIDAEVREEHGDGALWVAVSHGDLVKAVLADATGSGLQHFQSYTADPASVSAVRFGKRHTFLLAANVITADLSRFVPAPQSQPDGDAAVGGGVGGVGEGPREQG